jgi:elongation factor Ts
MTHAMTTPIDPKLVKQLRDKTGAGMMDCKRALEEASGDLAEAEKILRKKGVSVAASKAGRAAKEGVIGRYIHHGDKLGVLIEVNCETDFVARNEKFREFVNDIAMHIAASNPHWIKREDIPADVIESEKEIARAQVKGKPAAAAEKIVTGKLEKFYSQVCLLEQPFVKNPEITVGNLLTQKVAELGENIVIRRFTIYRVGEETA